MTVITVGFSASAIIKFLHISGEEDRGMNPTGVWAGQMGISHEIGLAGFLGHVAAEWSSCRSRASRDCPGPPRKRLIIKP